MKYNIIDTLRKCRDINTRTDKEPFDKVVFTTVFSY